MIRTPCIKISLLSLGLLAVGALLLFRHGSSGQEKLDPPVFLYHVTAVSTISGLSKRDDYILNAAKETKPGLLVLPDGIGGDQTHVVKKLGGPFGTRTAVCEAGRALKLPPEKCGFGFSCDPPITLQVDVSPVGPRQRDYQPILTGSLDFAEPALIRVRVFGIYKLERKRADDKVVNPAQVTLYYDDLEVDNDKTSPEGECEFTLTFPDNTPEGRSKHRLKAVVTGKRNETATASTEVEVRRGVRAVTLGVTPSASFYKAGSTLTLSGRVVARNAAFDTAVKSTIKVFDDTNRTNVVGRTETDDAGWFNLKLTGPFRIFVGDLDLTVVAEPLDSAHYADDSVMIELPVKGKAGLQVTVGTDKAVCRPGDTIRVTGIVSAEGKPVQGATVEAGIGDLGVSPFGRALTTDQDGRYMLEFSRADLPSDFLFVGHQILNVTAKEPQYVGSASASTYLFFQEDWASCTAQDLVVTQVSGRPAVICPFIPGQDVLPKPELARGGKLAQGMALDTGRGEGLTLALPFGGRGATFTIAEKSSVKIGRFCKDASGKIQLLLYVGNPATVRVDVPRCDPGTPGADYQLEIVTPSTRVTTVNTRYEVKVDDRGNTTVIDLEGAVRVSDLKGGHLDLDKGEQVTVKRGERIPPIVKGPETPVSRMTLIAEDRRVKPGAVATLAVWLRKGKDLASLNFTVDYDSKVAVIEGTPTRGNLLGNALFSANPRETGLLRLGVAGGTGLNGDGTVANLVFRAVGKPGSITPLRLKVTTAADSRQHSFLKPKVIDTIDGSIRILGPGDALKGDCNGDGILDARDAQCALDMSTKLIPEDRNLDMDGKDGVTAVDATLILQARAASLLR